MNLRDERDYKEMTVDCNQISEIKGWNWGAFMFNYAWGIGNRTYLPLLCLVPLVQLVMIFVVGAKGNEWAWKKGNWKDVETFKAAQATWNRAGFITFIIMMAVFIIYFFLFLLLILKVLKS